MTELSHLDDAGRARMVDVGSKPTTARVAVAEGRVLTTAAVVDLVARDGMPKADVLATARIAGISAAKRTSDLIPLCHQIPLSSVVLDFELSGDSIGITATAKTRSQTGVEMEALTAVALAGLTLHDMIKAVDPAATLTDVRLVSKSGGKRGDWNRDAHLSGADSPDRTTRDRGTAIVIVASTRAAAGTRADSTGPVIAEWLTARGFKVVGPIVIADAEIAAALESAVAAKPSVLVTTGGTGVSPTDATPEATAAVLDRELPGIAEAVRRAGAESSPNAALSRGLAGTAGTTFVINLPGSPGGVSDGLGVLDGVLDHVLDQLAGIDGHAGHHERGDARA